MPPIKKLATETIAAAKLRPHVIDVASPAQLPALSQVHGVRVTERALLDHTTAPAHTREVISSTGLEEGPKLARVPQFDLAASLLRFDVDGFASALHAALKDTVAGYVMQLRRKGAAVATREHLWAKRPTGNDFGAAWATSARMHVASVSKLITAMAMTNLLLEKHISFDAKIAGFLPAYWAKGPNVDKITFRQLMTHTSGFRTGVSNSDFAFMQSKVAAGVTSANLGGYGYENMNFGLCRILLATINGNVAPGATFSIPFLPSGNDLLWDFVTIGAYRDYCDDILFAPAGVSGPTLDHPSDDALAYRFPANGAGWDSGDLASMSGGAGWHMSVDDLLAVMGTFRRSNAIVQKAQAQGMLDDGFGIDLTLKTGLGNLYNKNGRWQNGSGDVEQSLAYFLPQDMELVVLANSPIGTSDTFFRTLVTDLITAHIEPRRVQISAKPNVLQP